jgi:hypothetical protein
VMLMRRCTAVFMASARYTRPVCTSTTATRAPSRDIRW